ncbi:Ankyrin repeat domain-containing protein 50 [Pseudocercospora fuligena]|uniref:Ankyrin repeat domain-containing protein 50 n=1 Tax=Pseudocercospora fuligena TaxID=685502 RepID=A0A8H6R6I2_9PEZI|nr:Ankyrin repeat domain-containing protein 50 [Pseudocercospora fuligena]
MAGMQALPKELFDLTIEHLVVTIGIRKAVLLRTVNRGFNASILHAICISKVISIHDPATPYLAREIGSTMRGRIVAAESTNCSQGEASYLSVVASVINSLTGSADRTNEELLRSQRETVAGAVKLVSAEFISPQVKLQNLLCGAALTGNVSIASALLDEGRSQDSAANVNGATPYFDNALSLAAGQGHLEMVHLLLQLGAVPSLASMSGHQRKRPITQADWYALDEMASGSALRSSHPSALRTAVEGGHKHILHLLLKHTKRLPTDDLEYLRAIVAGAAAGRLDLIHLVLNAIQKDLTHFPGLDNEMMWAAVRKNQKTVVQWLLDKGADINAYPYPDIRSYHCVLELAASRGHIGMVRFLLERGADVNFNPLHRFGNSPVASAAHCGHDEIVLLLLEAGADPEEAFVSAASGGQPRMLRILLGLYPDLVARDKGELGCTAFRRALCICNLSAMKILVEAGFPINGPVEDPALLPMNMAKQGFGRWIEDYMIVLGAQKTYEEADSRIHGTGLDGLKITQRTWQWAGRY